MIRKLAPLVVVASLFSSLGAAPATAVQARPALPASPGSPGSPGHPGDPGGPGDDGPGRSANGWGDQVCRVLPWVCR